MRSTKQAQRVSIPNKTAIPKATVASPLHYALILGPGRSGTTWLAQILNTYECCLLKYEPFQSAKPSPYLNWRHDLVAGDLVELRNRFDSLSRTCHSAVDMPPFPAKHIRKQNPHLLKLLFSMGKRFTPLQFLYETYGRATLDSDATILIKDVNLPGHLLPKLCDVLDPLTIAILRNPFATLASFYKGREIGLHSSSDRSDLIATIADSIERSGEPQFDRYRESLNDLSDTQLHALHWRLLAEPLFHLAQTSEQARLVVYEELCSDPETTIASLFEFLGWDMGDATRSFIAQTVAGDRKARSQQRAYFSVYRNPQAGLDKWKMQLSQTQKVDIVSIVRDSPVMTLWPQLTTSL